MKKYIMILVFALFIFGCVDNPQPGTNVTNTTSPPVIDIVGNTTNLTPEEIEPEEVEVPANYTVSLGDMVWVNYTLWVNGTVYDTNNATLANESGIYNPQRKYEPLSFQVAFNQGMIEGFVINVIGMKVNETVRFEVDPERGYGVYDPTKVAVIERYYNKSMHEVIPRAYLEEQGLNVTEGEGFETRYGTVFIESIDGDNVTLFYLLTPGTEFSFNGIPQRVDSIYNLTATIEYALEENKTYVVPHPETGAPTRFTVTEVNDQNITLDSNHQLAGETLLFDVTLLEVEPYVG